MTDTIFHKLQKQLDQYSLGFPATKSGIEIRILKRLFTEEEATVFSKLTPQLETPEQLAPRLGMDMESAASMLQKMAEKGLLFSLRKDNGVRYGAIPFVHGLFEFQVTRLDKELAELVRQYMTEEFKDAMAFSASHFLRVIPVQQSLDVKHQIAPYEDAVALLKKADPIVVTECVCRKSNQVLDQGCEKPTEVCFMFGSMAKYYLDHDMGRQVSLEEAVGILSQAREEGLVTQPATAQNPSGMCNCCGDCCGPLSSLKSYEKPAEMVFSNYYAEVDENQCAGCETCLDRCQMDALQMNEEAVARVNRDRCIGCGLCVSTCPTESITLIQKQPEDRKVPPESSLQQMLAMAQNRGVL